MRHITASHHESCGRVEEGAYHSSAGICVLRVHDRPCVHPGSHPMLWFVQIFTHYADHHSRKTRINRDKMFQFARDFDLTPQLIARKDIHDIVATVISDGTYVTFPQFVECIGMVAVMAAAKVGCVVGSNELPRMS